MWLFGTVVMFAEGFTPVIYISHQSAEATYRLEVRQTS